MVDCSFLSIPVGYVLGSIPSSYIVGRFVGKTDMRKVAEPGSTSAWNDFLWALPGILSQKKS